MSLHDALLQFGRQSGCSIVFDPELTRTVDSPGLHDAATPRAALEALIGAAALRFEYVAPELIAVQAREQPQPAPESRHPRPARAPRGDSAPPSVETLWVTAQPLTGSQIRGADLDGFAQVDVIDPTEIAASGHQSVGEVLRFLPAVAGNSTSTLVTNGGDGTATVTLRGLPASNTLVLIDGRRLNHDAFKAKSVDLNSIPLAMVERIEVLKDGASAVYGSDAIAGVVNLITRRYVEGLHVHAYHGRTGREDLETDNGHAVWGTTGPRGALVLGASYFRQGPIWSRDRAVSRSADDRSRGGIDQRSSATPYARVRVDDEVLVLRNDGVDGSDPAHFRPATDEDLFNFRDHTTAVVPSSHWGVWGNAELYFGDVRSWLDASHVVTDATNTLAQSPVITGFAPMELSLAADHPFNPFGTTLTDVRKRVLELGVRENRNRTESDRVALGIDVPLADWTVSAFGAYNRTRADEHGKARVHTGNLGLALGSPETCAAVAGCVPLNLLGPPGAITPEMLQFLSLSTHSTGRSSLQQYAVNVTGPLWRLPAGDVELATGLEYRSAHIATTPDPAAAGNLVFGGPNFGPTRGGRHSLEWYAEALVPLVSGHALAEQLDLSLATRVSDYSDFGNTSNPRVGVRYRPVADLLLRATRAEGFRAPTLQQLFISLQQSFEFLNDPCANGENIDELPGCLQQSDPTLSQFPTFSGGEPSLLPERAVSYTWGAVWTPAFAPGLELSADHYRIEQSNVVDSSAQLIVNQNARFGRFPEQVRRDGNGNITSVTATSLNIGRRSVSGWDFAAQYRLPETAAGAFDVALKAARIEEFIDQLAPDQPERDQAGTFVDEAADGNGSLPQWKANLGINWQRGPVEAQYNLHYVSTLDEVLPRVLTERTIDAWRVHNVQFSYKGPWTWDARVALGIDNLFDEPPPFSAAAFNDSFDARTYDLAGRYWYLTVSKRFE